MKIGEKTWLTLLLCVLGMVNAAQGQTIGAMPEIGDFGRPPKNAEAEQKAKAAEQKLSAERKAREDAEKRAARAERRALELERKQAVAGEGRKAGEVFRDCADCPEMVAIPSGGFEMGSSNDRFEKPVHTVMIGRAFALGKTEVTQGQWKAVMGSPPPELYFKNCGDDCPVESVSWEDAQEYIKRLSTKTGKTYRLPSEAEWEYACRAGGKYAYCGDNDIGKVAWYDKNSGDVSHPVGQKQANAWGLYDMIGNVWEWVEDVWHDDYKGAPDEGSAWLAGGNQGARVERGGSSRNPPYVANATNRNGFNSKFRSGNLGFRVARVLP